MNLQDIPPQVLSEVYRTIAMSHDKDIAQLNKESISDSEFMAALAYNQGSPLLEAEDLTEELLVLCRQHSKELELSSLAEYKFVPVTIKGTTLLAISSCPWDPVLVECINGYFPTCTQVKFALAGPTVLAGLLAKLQGEPIAAPVAGYAAKIPAPPQKPISPATPRPESPGVAPRPAVPSAGIPRPPGLARPVAKTENPKTKATEEPSSLAGENLLTPEDIAYLTSIYIQEANKIIQRKQAGRA